MGVISTHTDETYSSRIFRQLDFLLRELQLSLESFDLFAVNAGPGSFTGLRVGLTAAKAWADVFSKQVMPVSGLEAVAAEAADAAQHIISVIDARRGELYVGSYTRVADQSCLRYRLLRFCDDAVMSANEFSSWLQTSERLDAILATPSKSWLESILSSSNHVLQHDDIREVSSVLAPSIGVLAYSRFRQGEVVDALRLDANYVRRSDAEVNWKGK